MVHTNVFSLGEPPGTISLAKGVQLGYVENIVVGGNYVIEKKKETYFNYINSYH